MFPFDIEIEEADEDLEEDKKIPVEYEIDFSTGQLTGKKVYGLDAIKVWLWNCLSTPRYRYEHHTWSFGHELENLISESNDDDYINSTAEALITECLTIHPDITGIENFSTEIKEDTIICKFVVLTDLGNIEGVSIDV